MSQRTVLLGDGTANAPQRAPVHVGDLVLAAHGAILGDGGLYLRVRQHFIVPCRPVAVHRPAEQTGDRVLNLWVRTTCDVPKEQM